MIERASSALVTLALLSPACAPPRLDCPAPPPPRVTAVQPEPEAQNCDDWPHSLALRERLVGDAFALLEAIYAGERSPRADGSMHSSGLDLSYLESGEDMQLQTTHFAPQERAQLFDGSLGVALLRGTYGLPGREVAVGARWDVDVGWKKPCIRSTQGTGGMFDDTLYVHLFRTESEIERGFHDGWIVIFRRDRDGEWRIATLLSPNTGA